MLFLKEQCGLNPALRSEGSPDKVTPAPDSLLPCHCSTRPLSHSLGLRSFSGGSSIIKITVPGTGTSPRLSSRSRTPGRSLCWLQWPRLGGRKPPFESRGVGHEGQRMERVHSGASQPTQGWTAVGFRLWGLVDLGKELASLGPLLTLRAGGQSPAASTQLGSLGKVNYPGRKLIPATPPYPALAP